MPIKPITDCGKCHECGAELDDGLSDGWEWCPECLEGKHYRSHGWAGMGSAARYCPYLAVEYTAQSGKRIREVVRSGDEDSVAEQGRS